MPAGAHKDADKRRANSALVENAFAAEIQHIAVQKLKKFPRNARTHSRKQVDQIVASIRRFGWTNPILVNENTEIIAGHGRFEAALRMGVRTVPVIVVAGLSDAEQRALALADNKIALNAGWDRTLLARELGELGQLLLEYDLNLEITGFEPAESDVLLGDIVDDERDPLDEVPVIAKEPVSGKGDLWHLGPHRLLCGDARNAADFALLMDDAKAAAVFADPPYNLPVASIQGRGAIKHREFMVGSGEMSRETFTRFLTTFCELAARHSSDGSLHYICMDWRHLHEMLEAGEQVYGTLQNLVVWAKTNAGQGSLYRSQHELIFVFRNGDAPHLNNVALGKHGRNRSNLWSYAGVNSFRAGRMDELSVHPTVKPVALVADVMRDCTRRGDIILDAFLGSGTTTLAAERVGRLAYGLEIDPLYVDAAIRRWQAFTRRDAVLSSTGQTFDEVAALRAGVAPKQGRVRRAANG